MRLLASTDYALRALIVLAGLPPGERMSVEALAQRLGGLSRHHLHKIIQELTALGVTRTMRGVGGGAALAVPAGQVSLGAVVRGLEADQPIVECFAAAGSACTLLPGCRLQGMLGAAERAFHASLDACMLADCLPPGRSLTPR